MEVIVATVNSCYTARVFGTSQKEAWNIHRDKARNVLLGQANQDLMFHIKEFEVCPDGHGKPLSEQNGDMITFSYLKRKSPPSVYGLESEFLFLHPMLQGIIEIYLLLFQAHSLMKIWCYLSC